MNRRSFLKSVVGVVAATFAPWRAFAMPQMDPIEKRARQIAWEIELQCSAPGVRAHPGSWRYGWNRMIAYEDMRCFDSIYEALEFRSEKAAIDMAENRHDEFVKEKRRELVRSRC